jgi:hypothetical protein
VQTLLYNAAAKVCGAHGKCKQYSYFVSHPCRCLASRLLPQMDFDTRDIATLRVFRKFESLVRQSCQMVPPPTPSQLHQLIIWDWVWTWERKKKLVIAVRLAGQINLWCFWNLGPSSFVDVSKICDEVFLTLNSMSVLDFAFLAKDLVTSASVYSGKPYGSTAKKNSDPLIKKITGVWFIKFIRN